tara:strand:+ start:86 stop:1129 length:1044 start_codon:yes stop_codon:yes gene_type:complete
MKTSASAGCASPHMCYYNGGSAQYGDGHAINIGNNFSVNAAGSALAHNVFISTHGAHFYYHDPAGSGISGCSQYGNTAVGHEALKSGGTGIRNTAIGYRALGGASISDRDNTYRYNTAIGENVFAGTVVGGSSATNINHFQCNIGIGSCILPKLHCNVAYLDASRNIFIGSYMGLNQTSSGKTVANNILMGHYVANSGNGISNFVAIGYQSGGYMGSPCYGVSIGADSAQRQTCGCYNVAVGANAQFMQCLSFHGNVAVGYGAGYSNCGHCNVVIGHISRCASTSGCNNTVLGACSQTTINLTNVTTVGFKANATANNMAVLGSLGTTCTKLCGKIDFRVSCLVVLP